MENIKEWIKEFDKTQKELLIKHEFSENEDCKKEILEALEMLREEYLKRFNKLLKNNGKTN